MGEPRPCPPADLVLPAPDAAAAAEAYSEEGLLESLGTAHTRRGTQLLVSRSLLGVCRALLWVM